MGTFSVSIQVGNLQEFEELTALVDTGATTTVIPASILTAFGRNAHYQPDLRVRQRRTGGTRYGGDKSASRRPRNGDMGGLRKRRRRCIARGVHA